MRRGWRLRWLAVPAWLAVLAGAGRVAPPASRPSQVQVARQFLGAAARGETATAYGWLAPEVRRGLGPLAFAGALAAVQARGQARGAALQLYKLGFRLEEGGPGRPFVAYTWAADSALRVKREWLEVSFRDTAARAVWGFGWRQAAPGGH